MPPLTTGDPLDILALIGLVFSTLLVFAAFLRLIEQWIWENSR